MKNLRNERGAALVLALMLTFLTLAIVSAILYLVTQGTKVSSASKRYRNSLEASYGGADFLTKELMNQIYTGTRSIDLAATFGSASGVNLSFTSYSSCVKHKLTTATAQWQMGPGLACWSNADKFDLNSGPKLHPDVIFSLKGLPGQPNFKAYAQIVDSIPGNSDKSGINNLDCGSGVAGGCGGINPTHIPAVFTIEVQGEKEANPLEKARLSILYAY